MREAAREWLAVGAAPGRGLWPESSRQGLSVTKGNSKAETVLIQLLTEHIFVGCPTQACHGLENSFLKGLTPQCSSFFWGRGC